MSSDRISYRVFCETLQCEEDHYKAYGMQTYAGPIHDISPDRNVVETMAVLFNRMQLDPDKAGDVIERLLP